jgi:hypothetical protein
MEYVGHGCAWIRGSEPVNDGRWHHVAITWDADAKQGCVYVDGAEGTGEVGFSGGADNAGDTVRIGFSQSAHSSDNFTGQMDDVAIFDTTLTAEQVLELMRFRSGPITSATNPDPENGATEVSLQTALRWKPGNPAIKHDVYFGTDFKDVTGTTAEPTSVYKGRQPSSRFPAAQLKLDYGKTYC